MLTQQFGKDLDWTTSPYTPHDVATILRRYLTQMSEPVIPFKFYNAFRAVQVSDHTHDQKIREYKHLIRQMPLENQYLLLYLLDLLGIFSRESDKNLMTSANLAVIFQPGILSHPGHDMRPAESAISKDVVEFLINNQAHFVFGMTKRMSHVTRRTKSAAPAPKEPTPASSRRPTDDLPVAAGGAATGGDAPLSRPPAIPEDREASPQKSAPLPIPGASAPPTGQIIETPVARSPEPLLSPSQHSHATTPALATSPGPPRGQATSPVPPGPSRSPLPPREAAASPLSLAPSGKASRTSLTLQRPPAVRADTDYMLPSDSDDEAPPGGYYIVERAASPHRATSPLPASPGPTAPANALQSILPSPRPSRRSRERGRISLPRQNKAVPSVELLQPSDSDDEAPPGGYVVYENHPVGKLRTSVMGRAHSAAAAPVSRPTPSPTDASLTRSRTALESGEARVNSPKAEAVPGAGAAGLVRRRTLPTKRVSDFTARMRRAVREA